jgi:hypothetical protein
MRYEPAPTGGALRQGEILGPIWEHRAEYPPRPIPWRQSVRVRSIVRDMVVVLTPDCDLEWDYEMRFVTFQADVKTEGSVEDNPQAVSQVLVCQLHDRDQIRPRFKGEGDLWSRIKENQDERYRRFPAAEVEGTEDPAYLHELFLDFKKATSMPCERMYDGVLGGDVERIALVPPYYIHDLIHRFYGFLSRVALPE